MSGERAGSESVRKTGRSLCLLLSMSKGTKLTEGCATALSLYNLPLYEDNIKKKKPSLFLNATVRNLCAQKHSKLINGKASSDRY